MSALVLPPAVAGTGAETFSIETEDLVRRFGGTLALDHVSLAVRSGEFFSLLGPSGCGKTTFLRIVAGLDLPDAGRVRIGGRDGHGLPAHRRPVNTVFQSYALFPHLTAQENVAFGLRMKRRPATEIAARVRQVMELAQITDLASRKPAQLSGGQKQRVAVARAIVNEPQILLLDEPLGALDLKLRKELQVELRSLQRRLGITFVLVTHDQDEALALSDRIAVMRSGRIEQLAAGRELYERPRTRFVAEFLGACNVLETTVQHRKDGQWRVNSAIGPLCVNGQAVPRASSANLRLALAIRPERIHLRESGAGAGENWARASVEQVTYSGSATQYLLRAGGQNLRASAPNTGPAGHPFRAGQELAIRLPAEALIVLED